MLSHSCSASHLFPLPHPAPAFFLLCKLDNSQKCEDDHRSQPLTSNSATILTAFQRPIASICSTIFLDRAQAHCPSHLVLATGTFFPVLKFSKIPSCPWVFKNGSSLTTVSLCTELCSAPRSSVPDCRVFTQPLHFPTPLHWSQLPMH